tara:strand:- start:2844 stop:3644 length:801 start_codon:yes stop_codon:yes gene_type:complete
MKILLLGDIMGPSGREVIYNKLPNLIKEKNINFVIANGENADDTGVGITEEICLRLFDSGVNVVTSGNHIWDQKEIMEFISKEERLLRPNNFFDGSPGTGLGIYKIDNKKIAVLNLMGNIFMKKTDDLFEAVKFFLKKVKLNKEADFILVDVHGEITSEKNALAHFLDGLVTAVVGTHTHIPTNDFRILKKGTAYQTDIGMCGDYDSVIGMNKENSIKKFLKDKTATKHFPALGEATMSGLLIEADEKTGLAKKILPILIGGVLER